MAAPVAPRSGRAVARPDHPSSPAPPATGVVRHHRPAAAWHPPDAGASAPIAAPARVLVVAADPRRRAALACAVAGGGLPVQAVSTPADARTAGVERYGCLVVHRRRADDGVALALVAELYADPGAPPAVVVSDGDGGGGADALAAGAADHLTDPEPGELVVRVRRLTSRPAAAGSAPLRVGRLTIDRDRAAVRVGDLDLPVTPTQYALLVELARSRGRVVATRDLLARGWDAHQEVGAALLRPQVARLRRVLGGVVDLRCIRGVGYLLDVPDAASASAGSTGKVSPPVSVLAPCA